MYGVHAVVVVFHYYYVRRTRLIHGVEIGDFRPILPFISETVRDRPMVTLER